MTIEPSPEIAAVVRRWMEGHRAKNGRLLVNLLSGSEHLRYLGSAPGEAWTGDMFRDGFAGHVAEIPDYTVSDAALEAFERGESGWATWVGDIRFPARDEDQSVRFTFILVLEDGLWRIVQIHHSMAMSNAQATGVVHHAFAALIAAAQEKAGRIGEEGAAVIMFTDVANSTEIAGALGDRAWATEIGALLDVQAEAIVAQGGTVVKTLGDGAMASFPAAGRALRAALAIQSAASAREGSPRLEVRIGVHAGDVIQSKGDFFGTVVNHAARVAALARPGEILVSDVARAMVGPRGGFTFDAPVRAALRGIEGRHEISTLRGAL